MARTARRQIMEGGGEGNPSSGKLQLPFGTLILIGLLRNKMQKDPLVLPHILPKRSDGKACSTEEILTSSP